MSIPGAQQFNSQRIAILGLGVSGGAALSALGQHTSAILGVWDSSAKAIEQVDSTILDCAISDAEPTKLIASLLAWQPDLVIIAPGFPQTGIEWQELRKTQIPVWSEIELAWHLRAQDDDGHFAPWLCVTGTNGKTTTVDMLQAMLRASGKRALAVGNVGTAAVTAVSDLSDQAPEVFVCELSSFQLAATYSMEPTASIVLNIADDHLEWHGNRTEYARAKANIYERTHRACIFPVGDSNVQAMVDNADVVEGARAIGLSLGIPSPGELGLVDDVVVDRAFVRQMYSQAEELFTLADVAHLAPPSYDLPVHIVKDAIAAAALARAIDTPSSAIAAGLREFHADRHRIEFVAEHGGVTYIDDSKATNAHAAQASLLVQKPANTVWIVGGLSKGAQFDTLVERVADRLAGVVVIGLDQRPWRSALSALKAPVTYIDEQSQNPMREAVTQAAELAQPGNTVLLAPASASQDQFTNYGERGAIFADMVRELIVTGGEK
ncbi:UDP-N-acetylmuramoyl-L-alanine--D-glutamate ligase [Arcanobacterium buesumense]|uniref:UDP-N-acetylmuramoylalanine--D-glutamate ligase n=1 Tax=Arcanobacterium buesumense TaxID=2722751 RepID=A0A6H2EKX6_9ACTO|nr:UDP-N-acetylmuramoyl-L-alanine--D-glutamate ligase [Arcanobacterium buesumense]QJC21609.1 UDP-N-acetylmuramoyl-L-alanine--D-glutamate ligase [Arcanobacterium buesumense]